MSFVNTWYCCYILKYSKMQNFDETHEENEKCCWWSETWRKMVAATMISNSFLVVTILLVGSCTIPRANGEPLFFKGFSNNRPNSGGNKYFWDIFGIFGSKNKSPSSSYGSNTISSSYGAPPSYKPTYEPPGSVKPSYAPPGPVKPSYEPPEQVKPSYKPDKPSYKPVIPSYESPPLPALPSYSTPGVSIFTKHFSCKLCKKKTRAFCKAGLFQQTLFL